MAGGIFEYPLPAPARSPFGIVAATDGNLWFTEQDGNRIGRYDPVTNVLTEFMLPTANSRPDEIVQGSDGNLWFTEANNSKIGRMTTAGILTGEFSFPGGGTPEGIAAGPDNRLWFFVFLSPAVSKIERMTTAGVTTVADQFTIPTANSGAGEISRGPAGDNNLWFPEFNAVANKIGRINATTGVINEFSVPTASSGPNFIAPGPDGRMWFTEETANKIARITTAGVITPADEFPVPGGFGGLNGIVTGPDGNLWFAEGLAHKIGRITPTGPPFAQFTFSSAGSDPRLVTKGPDNNIWFTESSANAIGKLVLDRALTGQPVTITPTEGSEFTGEVAFFADADPTAVAGDFTANIAWGNGNMSAGTIAPASGGGFTVTGINTYGEEGPYTIKVTITDINDTNDTGGSTVMVTSTANVRDAALSASAVTFIYPIGTEGFAITNLTLAYFVDGGGPEAFANYTVTVDWGDATPATPGTLSLSGELFSVAASHTYAEEDPRTVQITIKDEGGSMITVNTPITLYDAAVVPTSIPISTVEGAVFSGPVATFVDTGGPEVLADYVASIDWGDGTAPTTGSITLSGTTFTVSGSHTYSEEGQYVMSMTVVHETYGTCIFEAIATVADAPLLATANSLSATEGAVFQGVVASFNDTAVLQPANHYSASIAWGDGNTSAGTLTANGSGGYDISGNNTYAEEGSYTVTVTIQDEGGSSITVTGTTTVADAALAAFGTTFSGTAGVALTNVPVAFFADAGGAEPVGNYTVSIDWGDLTGPDPTGTINAAGPLFQVTGNHTYGAPGTYMVNVTITDDGGSSIVATTPAIIGPGASPPPGGGGAIGGVRFPPFVAPLTPDLSSVPVDGAAEAHHQAPSDPVLVSGITARQAADLLFSNARREDRFVLPWAQAHALAQADIWLLDSVRREAW